MELYTPLVLGADRGDRDGDWGQVQTVHPCAGGVHQRKLLGNPRLQQAVGRLQGRLGYLSTHTIYKKYHF